MPAPWSEALRSHTLATLARLTGKHAEAQSRLRAATEHFGAADMQLHAHASMRQLGMSVGGTEGRTLQGTADAWFLKQGVVDPDAMGRMVLADVTPLSRQEPPAGSVGTH